MAVTPAQSPTWGKLGPSGYRTSQKGWLFKALLEPHSQQAPAAPGARPLGDYCLHVTPPPKLTWPCRSFSQKVGVGVQMNRKDILKKQATNHGGYYLIHQGPAICQGIYTFYLKKFTVFIIHNYEEVIVRGGLCPVDRSAH